MSSLYPKVIHWSDDLREREGPSTFEVPGTMPTYVPTKPPLPAIICGPVACDRLKKKSEPLAEGIVERGLGFDRAKLEALLNESLAEIERLDAKLPRGCDKSASGLLKTYARGQYDMPYGAVPIDAERQLWRAHPYSPLEEINAIMRRLRPRRLAALITNILAALDETGRVHSPVFTSALNGAVPAFDPRELTFPSLLPTLKAPALVIHLPDLALRSLAFAVGDTTLTEILGGADPWAAVYQRVYSLASLTPTDYQRAEAREFTIGHLFGRDLESVNEWFGGCYLPRVDADGVPRGPQTVELHEGWIASLSGWRTWRNQIDSATCDTRMMYQSAYSDPNPRRSREQTERLLRENTLVTSRAVGLTTAETLASSEPRGRGRPPKVEGAPELVAALGDYFVIECPTEPAAELGAAIKENVTALFTENLPGFPLAIEIKNL